MGHPAGWVAWSAKPPRLGERRASAYASARRTAPFLAKRVLLVYEVIDTALVRHKTFVTETTGRCSSEVRAASRG
jgi:hypothetical protein